MKKIIYTLIIAIAIFLGYGIGKSGANVFDSIKAFGDYGSQTIIVGDGKAVDLTKIKVLDEVKTLIDKKFISWKASSTIPTEKEIEYSIIRGYVSAYNDPYTTYFPPAEAKSFEQNVKGSFGGVGMEVGEKAGLITVIAPMKGSPAEKGGIKSGDIVTAINGTSTEGMSVEKAVSIIRGEIGTTVNITIARKEATSPLIFTLKREEIKIPTVETEIVKGVFVIHLYNFSADSPTLFQDALQKFMDSKLNRLVIDLRGNPGGYLEAAVNIASFFLPEGAVVVSEKGNKELGENVHRSKGLATWSDNIKISVIVDEGSASASEILAGALKDHKVAKVYGQKSYGKGSVQELINLSDGSSIKITVATWYTPNGTSITESKIVPDVEVKRTDKSTYKSELNTIVDLILKAK